MCGRYYIAEEENARILAIFREMEISGCAMSREARRGEIFPSQVAPVIVANETGFTVRPMLWGFPRGNGHGLVINSRSEKADYTPMFQKAVRERRCLVPMSGFYEWRRTSGGGKSKDKFAFALANAKPDELMYLAGVYGEFAGGFRRGGFDGFAILTRDADEQMKPYHERMPVILRDEALKRAWLAAPSNVPYAELRRQFQAPRLAVAQAAQDQRRAGEKSAPNSL